jgi:xylose isomerase
MMRILAERYAGWEAPAAKAMLSGNATLEGIAGRVAREGLDPKPRSGRQEYLENLRRGG